MADDEDKVTEEVLGRYNNLTGSLSKKLHDDLTSWAQTGASYSGNLNTIVENSARRMQTASKLGPTMIKDRLAIESQINDIGREEWESNVAQHDAAVRYNAHLDQLAASGVPIPPNARINVQDVPDYNPAILSYDHTKDQVGGVKGAWHRLRGQFETNTGPSNGYSSYGP